MARRKTPGGGPKPDKLMRDALALELHQEVKLKTGEKVKKLRLVARSLVDNAIDGDTSAARECFDRMDGKVTQSVDATSSARRRHVHLEVASEMLKRYFRRSSGPRVRRIVRTQLLRRSSAAQLQGCSTRHNALAAGSFCDLRLRIDVGHRAHRQARP